MNYKKSYRKKEKTIQQKASEGKKKYNKTIKGKKVILIPHPTIPNTMIEKIVE
jgi:uncharacterized protein YbbC (DUF1343 family)